MQMTETQDQHLVQSIICLIYEMEVLNDYIDFYHGEKVGVGLVLSSGIYHKAAEKMLAEDFKVKDAMPIEEDLIREIQQTRNVWYHHGEDTPNLLEQVDPKLIEHKEEIAAIINEIPTDEELIAMINKVEGKIIRRSRIWWKLSGWDSKIITICTCKDHIYAFIKILWFLWGGHFMLEN